MKRPLKRKAPFNRHNCLIAIAVPCALAAPPVAWGQAALQRSPSQLDAPAAARLIDQERTGLTLTPGSSLYLDPNSFLRWGPVTVRPHFDASFSYASGLRSPAGRNENVVIESISPGILFEIGPRWNINYTPTLTYYSSKSFQDNLAHAVMLNGAFAYQDWVFKVSQDYSVSSTSLLETGRQTSQENINTTLGASHYLNSKLMLDLELMQNFRSADALTSSHSWSTMDWLNYQVASRVSIGAGIGGGFEQVNLSNDMTFEQVRARVDVRIKEKLNVAVNGGGEVRQILDSGGDPLINPIYGASVIYHPFTYTTLSLAGNRAISSSLLIGQITESTDISLGLNQRLFGALYGSMAGSFRNTRFIFSNSSEAVNRTDDALTFYAGLSYSVFKRGTLGLNYSYTDNTSSDRAFNQATHQIGVTIGYHF